MESLVWFKGRKGEKTESQGKPRAGDSESAAENESISKAKPGGTLEFCFEFLVFQKE